MRFIPPEAQGFFFRIVVIPCESFFFFLFHIPELYAQHSTFILAHAVSGKNIEKWFIYNILKFSDFHHFEKIQNFTRIAQNGENHENF